MTDRAWALSVRNAYVSTLCPVVLCPYLCTSDRPAGFRLAAGLGLVAAAASGEPPVPAIQTFIIV